MAKREKNIIKRSKFCQLALKDHKQAAAQLRTLATGLENCRNTTDIIKALCEIFAVSEQTICNDLMK